MAQSEDLQNSEVFDCLVLSGGGSKGAYGAGVAKAIEEFRSLRGINRQLCFIGTSAGALNASVLAAADAESLIAFWRGLTTNKLLNVRIPAGWKSRAFWNGAMSRLFRKPFAIYSHKALAELIERNVDIATIQERGTHLIIAATSYTKGEMRSFFVSPLIDDFVRHDEKAKASDRRLINWKRLTDNDHLRAVLLASSAIPLVFPTVPIDGELYVDGGIGNHTPTREAAYFLRHLQQTKMGVPGRVYCVTQDPPRTLIEGKHTLGPYTVLMRTLDVYHKIHTTPIVSGWFRINKEVERHEAELSKLRKAIEKISLTELQRSQVDQAIADHLGSIGDSTRRSSFDLMRIEPSSDLGDSLTFDPGLIDQNITRGYTDVVERLRERGDLEDAERQMLLNKTVLAPRS